MAGEVPSSPTLPGAPRRRASLRLPAKNVCARDLGLGSEGALGVANSHYQTPSGDVACPFEMPYRGKGLTFARGGRNFTASHLGGKSLSTANVYSTVAADE